MSRSFQEYYENTISYKRTSMCDPLVINLDGNIADLSDQTFLFDIDGDGKEDEINRLGAGSGFLALDKNGDGIINDGSELFGTKSGNGFADLAAYDTDHNGFIDEGDEIWDKLKIWVMDENGNQQLYSLSACRMLPQTIRLPMIRTRQREWYGEPAYFSMKTEMWELYSTWTWHFMNSANRKK